MMRSQSSGGPVTNGRRAVRLAMAIAAGGFILSACSSGGSAAGPPPSTTPASGTAGATATSVALTNVGLDYERDIVTADAAIDALVTDHAFSSTTTDAQAAAAAQPSISAIKALQPKLLRLADADPATAKALEGQVTASDAIENDLSKLSTLDFSANVGAWSQQFVRDATQLDTASAAVRAQLGLPLAKNQPF
jgi:hypothetical protein